MRRNLGTRGGRGNTTTQLGRNRLRARGGGGGNGEAGTGSRRAMNDLMALG